MTELTTLEFLWLTLDSRLAGSLDMQHIVIAQSLDGTPSPHGANSDTISAIGNHLLYNSSLLTFSFLANSALESLASGKKPT